MSEEETVMVMHGIWIREDGRDVEFGRRNVVPLRPELLAAGGSVANPRARTIGPRRRKRLLMIISAMLVLTLAAIAWGLVYMAVWAIAFLWRCAEPSLTVLAVGVALAAIVVGIGLPG